MKQSIKYIAIPLYAVLVTTGFVFMPISSSAQNQPTPAKYEGLVKCDGALSRDDKGRRTDLNEVECNFSALVKGINTIINWLFFLAIPISIGLFTYAGFLYMTGVESNISKAKDMFFTVGKGFILMLLAWFIVYTIISWLTEPDQGFLQLLGGK